MRCLHPCYLNYRPSGPSSHLATTFNEAKSNMEGLLRANYGNQHCL